ncbi:MAG: hypothetical protein ACJAVF_004546 [Paraglaciecola sp.]
MYHCEKNNFMARLFKEFYTPELLEQKQKFYGGLGEKASRHFLGQEYLSLGKGSQRYLSRVFNCSRNTIYKGEKEVKSADFNPDYNSQRQEGGGRKKKKPS